MTSDQFVYWLQGFLEVSGASEMSEQQLRIVRDHLELVLSKRTPAYVQHAQPAPVPMWETVSGFQSVYPTGPKCGTCGVVCSEEGGTCKRCVRSKGRLVYCDACGEQRLKGELTEISTENIAGVVICSACKNPTPTASVPSDPGGIINVPLHLTC
jgi:hypothetical protein